VKQIRQARTQSIGLLCLILFLFTAPLSRTFLHAHTLPDGQILVHSHIFSGSDGQNSTSPDHSHTHKSLLFHHFSSGDFDLALPVFKPDLFHHQSTISIKFFTSIAVNQFSVFAHGNRAPPF
jgi:hypothetical protein